MKKNSKDINLSTPLRGTNGQLMVTAALRYCLGRRSYIVISCQEWLTSYWPLVDNQTRVVLICDIVTALMDDEAGDAFDFESWKRFAVFGWDGLSNENRVRVKNSVAYKKKEWPL